VQIPKSAKRGDLDQGSEPGEVSERRLRVAAPSRSRRHFLVVEDREDFGKTLKKALERWVDVTWVRTFDEAVPAFSSRTFCALIVDVHLPKRSGFEVLEEFREVHPRTPAMVLTGFFAAADSVRACELGAQYVATPISTRALAVFVEFVYGRRESENATSSLSRATYDYIRRIVSASPSRAAAARALGVTPRSLRRMLSKVPPPR
jgi:ActR/RegA family two-component response regulator